MNITTMREDLCYLSYFTQTQNGMYYDTKQSYKTIFIENNNIFIEVEPYSGSSQKNKCLLSNLDFEYDVDYISNLKILLFSTLSCSSPEKKHLIKKGCPEFRMPYEMSTGIDSIKKSIEIYNKIHINIQMLTKQNNELTKKNNELTKQNNELTKQNNEFINFNIELTKENIGLTKKIITTNLPEQSLYTNTNISHIKRSSNKIITASEIYTESLLDCDRDILTKKNDTENDSMTG
jgi:FtsZ-binding cell division protein ZapB